MSDLAIAAFIMTFLVGLAVAAPIWGVDSRDGVESDQPSRRAAWLHDRQPGRAGSSPAVVVAGALRTVAYRLDARLAEAC
jgi:hypothetical protein